MDLPNLLSLQNADGGWGYFRGGSATEPTTFALLALSISGRGQTVAAEKGIRWLAASQRSDGGWPPSRSVEQSTWVTALPLILPGGFRAHLQAGLAKNWLLRGEGRESRWSERVASWASGGPKSLDFSQKGWPFYPDTAAWVAPTAFAVLGLERFQSDTAAQSRCQMGRSFLRSRLCTDGGWNHGSHRALGYDLASYPETTGLALLALHRDGNETLGPALIKAQEQLVHAKSREAACWLRLGLQAHGIAVRSSEESVRPPRSVMELALTAITSEAAQGRNVFIES